MHRIYKIFYNGIILGFQGVFKNNMTAVIYDTEFCIGTTNVYSYCMLVGNIHIILNRFRCK